MAPFSQGFRGGLVVKNLLANAEDAGSIPGLGSSGAWEVKNPPAMWATWVQSLGWEDRLEEGVAIHSSILA